MTIDEAIANERKVAKRNRILLDSDELVQKSYDAYFDKLKCEKCAEEHEQLAEWLEELKAYKAIGTVEGYKNAIECYTKEYLLRRNLQDQIKEQYNKAIDDALSVVEWDGYTIDIKERIEQLKRI